MLDKIINECLEKYEGGEKFFDALDYQIRNNDELLDLLINIINDIKYDYIVVSGHFGSVFKTYCKNTNKWDYTSIIKVSGGLRKEKEVEDFYKHYDIKNKKIIFLDDTHFSGTTKNKIVDCLKCNNSNYIGTYVIYDGSKIKSDDVTSMYRYYDHFS